jgi:hypothetical protein
MRSTPIKKQFKKIHGRYLDHSFLKDLHMLISEGERVHGSGYKVSVIESGKDTTTWQIETPWKEIIRPVVDKKGGIVGFKEVR